MALVEVKIIVEVRIDEQGKVDKLEQGTEANSGTKDQGTGANYRQKSSRYRS
ncbi:hypothetical protein HYD80_03915 [Mycoplasmopsis bovis]|nr:hypothetical protein [Mycoplasmopsis bovis]QQH42938.1 hypothetical protein HYD80_03915 [Mycoplasmopsis bovis]